MRVRSRDGVSECVVSLPSPGSIPLRSRGQRGSCEWNRLALVAFRLIAGLFLIPWLVIIGLATVIAMVVCSLCRLTAQVFQTESTFPIQSNSRQTEARDFFPPA